MKMLSAARCARVSYLTQDGLRDQQEDFKLYERLVTAKPMHASPLEHVATPCECEEFIAFPVHDEEANPYTTSTNSRVLRPDHRGNFRGWDQLRHHVWNDPDDE
jgi:hypothetical protein